MPVTDQDIQTKKQELQVKRVACAQARVTLAGAMGEESVKAAELSALVAQKQLEDMENP